MEDKVGPTPSTATTRYREIQTAPLASFAVRAEARRQERLTPAEYRLLDASTRLFARRAMIRADLDQVRLFRGQAMKHRHAYALYRPSAAKVEEMLTHDLPIHRKVWLRCVRELHDAGACVAAERYGHHRMAAE